MSLLDLQGLASELDHTEDAYASSLSVNGGCHLIGGGQYPSNLSILLCH